MATRAPKRAGVEICNQSNSPFRCQGAWTSSGASKLSFRITQIVGGGEHRPANLKVGLSTKHFEEEGGEKLKVAVGISFWKFTSEGALDQGPAG